MAGVRFLKSLKVKLPKGKKANKTKPKKEVKMFPAKKMPGMFKKSYSEKKLETKILKKLYVPEDKKSVGLLFEKGANEKKPELMSLSMERKFTKAELKRYRMLAKQIKKQKSVFSVIPFAAVAVFFVAVGIFVSIFKNPVTKKILIVGGQKVAGAKTEIRSVNLEIFGTSLTINGISLGNKNEEFKNLFEAEKIEISFSLAQALRGKFDCKNIEASGMKFNTDRKKSNRLPAVAAKEKKEKNDDGGAFMASIAQKKDSAVSSLKSQAQSMLGGSSPDEIVKSLESKLKVPDVAEDAKNQAEAMVAKWKDRPDELKKQVEDFSDSVKKLQKIDAASIKNVAELKAALEEINGAIEKSKSVKESVSVISSEVMVDSKTVAALGDSIRKAAADDKAFVENTVGSAVDSVKNAKSILNDAIEAIAMDSLGKYYPYAKKGLSYVESMKSSPADKKNSKPKEKKAKKSKKQANKRMRGTTFWYGTTKPSFLIERIYASGPNFEARITDVSNDMDLLGKPIKGESSFAVGKTSHKTDFTVDARTNSKAKLVTANYKGSGFDAKIDGSKVAASSGIPSINGTASLTMTGTFDFGEFNATGDMDLNPVKLNSDGIGNEMATKYYNKALSSITRIKASYSAGYTEKDGVDFSLRGNFGDQFGKALSSVVSEAGDEAKKVALAKLNERINGYSNEALESVKKFAGIEGDINAQNASLASVQKVLDGKKGQIEKEIKKRASDKVEKAVGDKLPDGTKKALKSLPLKKLKK